jgi:hypothetical protein
VKAKPESIREPRSTQLGMAKHRGGGNFYAGHCPPTLDASKREGRTWSHSQLIRKCAHTIIQIGEEARTPYFHVRFKRSYRGDRSSPRTEGPEHGDMVAQLTATKVSKLASFLRAVVATGDLAGQSGANQPRQTGFRCAVFDNKTVERP